MSHRSLAAGIGLSLLLLAASGCHCFVPPGYMHAGPPPGPAYHGPPAVAHHGPPVAAYGGPHAEVIDEGPIGCTDPGCAAPAYFHVGLWRSLFGCRFGCGEFYYDEWLSDKPAPCDPCDNHGQYVGPRDCCGLGWLPFHWHQLWGYRYHDAGCESPVPYGGDMHYGGGMPYGGEVLGDEFIEAGPPPVPTQVEPKMEQAPAPPKQTSSVMRRSVPTRGVSHRAAPRPRTVRRPYPVPPAGSRPRPGASPRLR